VFIPPTTRKRKKACSHKRQKMDSTLNPSDFSFTNKTFFIALFYHKEKALPKAKGLLDLVLLLE
jgi:hypothetical protein